VVSFDRSLLKGEAPRFLADLTIISLVKRPFKLPCHLVQALEINRMIAMLDIFIAPYSN
jgi:hypothetical protein